MSILLSLLLATRPQGPAETTAVIEKLIGRWVLAIELPDQTEPVLLEYRRLPDGRIQSRGIAYPLGKPPLSVQTTFRVDKGQVVAEERQGSRSSTFKARSEDGRLICDMGQGVLDELAFEADGSASGAVRAGERVVARYRMRRPSSPDVVLALQGLDPVEVGAGRPTPGKEGIQAEWQGYRYRFASDANKAEFLRQPDLHKLQFGGACMNMGPLSGRGRQDLYTVHAGRTYVFASETCRSRFLSDPEDYIDRPDPKYQAVGEAPKQGKRRLDAIARAHGGDALDRIRTLTWHRNQPFDSNGTKKPYVSGWALDVKGRYAQRETWDDRVHMAVALPTGGHFGYLDQLGPIDPDERAYLIRQAVRHPIWLLRHRKSKDLAAVPGPPVDLPGIGKCDATMVSYQGSNTVLLSDPRTSELRGIQHFGRGATAQVLSTRVYTAWTESAGVRLPTAWTITREGAAPTTGGVDAVLVNVGAEGYFARHL